MPTTFACFACGTVQVQNNTNQITDITAENNTLLPVVIILKIMNYRELRDFCNNLPEFELEKKVILWREDAEDVITEIDAEQLDEDYYIKVDSPEDGCFPVSESKELEPDIKIKRVYKKGHPILSESF